MESDNDESKFKIPFYKITEKGLEPYTEEEERELERKQREKEKKDKELLGDLYNIILRYKHLIIGTIEPYIEYFVLMEEWKKPATELEIYIHCTIPIENKRIRMQFCHTIGCESCEYSIKEVLDKIQEFRKELERFGYYTGLSKNYSLYVSKNKELVDILTNKMSEPVPVYYHTMIRGLAFGYTEDEVFDYIRRSREIEIDWITATRVKKIVSEMIKGTPTSTIIEKIEGKVTDINEKILINIKSYIFSSEDTVQTQVKMLQSYLKGLTEGLFFCTPDMNIYELLQIIAELEKVNYENFGSIIDLLEDI